MDRRQEVLDAIDWDHTYDGYYITKEACKRYGIERRGFWTIEEAIEWFGANVFNEVI